MIQQKVISWFNAQNGLTWLHDQIFTTSHWHHICFSTNIRKCCKIIQNCTNIYLISSLKMSANFTLKYEIHLTIHQSLARRVYISKNSTKIIVWEIILSAIFATLILQMSLCLWCRNGTADITLIDTLHLTKQQYYSSKDKAQSGINNNIYLKWRNF